MEDSARRLVAAMEGALEGFVQALDEHDVQEEAKLAAQRSARMGRAVMEEGRAQAQSPEMRQVAGYAQRVGAAAGGTTAGVRESGHAVARSARRAVRAPPRILRECRRAAGAWWSGVTAALLAYALLGVLGLTAFIILTIALVVGLNAWAGDPWGTFLVALLDLVLGGIVLAVARGARTRARREVREHMRNSREQIRHVTQPVRQTFGRGRPGA